MKVDRLIGIVMLLLDKERVGAGELADMFEVSPRTIYRDIDAIGMAGIPVRAMPGVGGGFEIMPEYKVDNKVFTSNDLASILTGLSSLSGMMRGDELANALAKVKSFIPAEKAREIEVQANQVHIDISPWMGNKHIQPYLETIKAALRENRLLAFDYADSHGNKTARTAEPYRLVLKGNHWYWQGFCHTRQDYRLFKLSRMSGLQMLADTFTPREYQKPNLEFAEMLETMQTEIKIRIHQSVMDTVLDYCGYENFSPDGDTHYIVRFPFIENDYYYNILFSLGDQCECLAPQHVRAEMKRRIQNIAKLYSSP